MNWIELDIRDLNWTEKKQTANDWLLELYVDLWSCWEFILGCCDKFNNKQIIKPSILTKDIFSIKSTIIIPRLNVLPAQKMN